VWSKWRSLSYVACVYHNVDSYEHRAIFIRCVVASADSDIGVSVSVTVCNKFAIAFDIVTVDEPGTNVTFDDNIDADDCLSCTFFV